MALTEYTASQLRRRIQKRLLTRAAPSSKREAQGHLNVPLQVHYARDRAEIRRRGCQLRSGEGGVIECVEELRPELKHRLLLDTSVLQDRAIDIVAGIAPQA